MPELFGDVVEGALGRKKVNGVRRRKELGSSMDFVLVERKKLRRTSGNCGVLFFN